MIIEPGPHALAWLDGEIVPWTAATIHISDHHYGVGVFEGVRTYSGRNNTTIFRMHDHTRRLLRSARILNIQLPEHLDEAALNQAQVDLMRRNEFQNAYIRPFVFHSGFLGLSPGIRGLRVRVAILALEWRDDGAFASGQSARRGISLRTASYIQHHSSSLLTKAKANANYMTGVLAREESRENGADDALLLDRDGFVTETSGANIFAVIRGVLCTPPLDSVLEGVTRDTVMTLAASLGAPVVERRMARDDIYTADEVFLTGTAAEVTPVCVVDARPIASGAPGPLTTRIQGVYANLVRGEDDTHQEWLTRI